jgi:hypothetical protein
MNDGMATEKQANRARELHSDLLAQWGAHAIGVINGSRYGKRGFVLVAYVEQERNHRIPDKLKCNVGKDSFEVAVVTKPMERFSVESPDKAKRSR